MKTLQFFKLAFLPLALLGAIGIGTTPTTCSAAEVANGLDCGAFLDELLTLCELDPEWVEPDLWEPEDGPFNQICVMNAIIGWCNCEEIQCVGEGGFTGPPGGGSIAE
jgi:hypothetical protein